jgi:hypothetical protein
MGHFFPADKFGRAGAATTVAHCNCSFLQLRASVCDYALGTHAETGTRVSVARADDDVADSDFRNQRKNQFSLLHF